MTLGSDPAPFHMLPEGESRLGRFGAGFLIEAIFLLLLIVIPLLMPDKMNLVTKYWSMPIAAPPVTPFKPQPPKPVEREKVVPKEVVKEIPKPAIVVPPKPRIQTPVFTSPIAKPATAKKNTANPDAPEVAKVMPPTLTPGNVGTGSSAIPTLKKPREMVQTGGFGDPNGVPSTANTGHAANIAHLGAYDLPPGPGYGNGTGGAKGARGVVSSGGFGNGAATGTPGGGGGGGRKVVESGSFNTVAAAPTPKSQQAAASPVASQVEIISTPRPAYTDDARNLKIEGDVLIAVTFTASGQVQVERVVKGLGHGLDESAMAAARQIRFKPAKTADGQPVDSQAVVHILFELAY
jgi:TonB family protein